MRYVLTAALIIVGIIHLLPLAGVPGADRLQFLYGISLTDSSQILLMRHRAILFGMLGSFFVVSVFVPTLHLSALILGTVSVISFLVLANMGGPVTPSIARVVAADWVALAALVAGFVAYAILRQRS